MYEPFLSSRPATHTYGGVLYYQEKNQELANETYEARAAYDLKSRSPVELELHSGDVIFVFRTFSEEWVYAENQGRFSSHSLILEEKGIRLTMRNHTRCCGLGSPELHHAMRKISTKDWIFSQ